MNNLKKITLVFAFLSLAFDSFSYKLLISRKVIGNNGGNSQDVKRDVEDIYANDINGNAVLIKRIVTIHCIGNGAVVCVKEISLQNDNPTLDTQLPLAAINSAQNLFTDAVNLFESGQLNGSSSGNIMIPDGTIYSYTIIWTTDTDGTTSMSMTFED